MRRPHNEQRFGDSEYYSEKSRTSNDSAKRQVTTDHKHQQIDDPSKDLWQSSFGMTVPISLEVFDRFLKWNVQNAITQCICVAITMDTASPTYLFETMIKAIVLKEERIIIRRQFA